MIIQPTSLAALTWAGAASGTTAQSWRIGSVLSARPLGVNPQGLLVLQVGAMLVEAEVAGGQLPAQFQVRVLSMGAQPQLEILSHSADPTLQRALRERLPQQNGYAPLLATLGALAQHSVIRQLPPTLRAALAMLDQGIHLPEEVTRGEGLRQAILGSGVFLEARLAQPRSDLAALGAGDWKALLLHLAAVLENHAPPHPAPRGADTPPPLHQRGLQAQPRQPPPDVETLGVGPLIERLHDDVRAALARIEVSQLDNAQRAATAEAPARMQPQSWMIEIPVHGEDGRDVLQVQIEHGRDGEDGLPFWVLGFALALPALGPVQGELQLRDLRLSVRLWAERTRTVEKLEGQFAALRHRLSACGVLLDQLSCQVGLPHGQGHAGALLLKATA